MCCSSLGFRRETMTFILKSAWSQRADLFCFNDFLDVNECSSNQHECGPYATCYNTPGSYKCKCKDDYRGVGHDCKREYANQNIITARYTRS